MDTMADLDGVPKRKFLTLTGLEIRPLGRLACSQSPYQLSHPGPNIQTNVILYRSVYYKLAFALITVPLQLGRCIKIHIFISILFNYISYVACAFKM
jgi:hypothetical protein